MKKFNEKHNPTIYSIVSTHYYILKLIFEFYSWSCTTQCEPYYGLIVCPEFHMTNENMSKSMSTIYPIQSTLFYMVKIIVNTLAMCAPSWNMTDMCHES